VADGHLVNITMQSRTSEYSVNITAVNAPETGTYLKIYS